MAMRPWLIVVAMLLCPLVALAHEVRPAYLQIRQNGPDTYDVLWKVPGRGDGMRLGLYVELPNDCVRLGAARPTFVDNAYTERWSVKRAGGLNALLEGRIDLAIGPPDQRRDQAGRDPARRSDSGRRWNCRSQ